MCLAVLHVQQPTPPACALPVMAPAQADQATKIKADVAAFSGRVDAFRASLRSRAFYVYATGPTGAYPVLRKAKDELDKLSKVWAGRRIQFCRHSLMAGLAHD